MTGSPWFDALLDPAALLVLATAVLAGLLAAWWLFPLGILLWLFMVVRNLTDPSLRLNQTIQNRKDVAQRFMPAFNSIQKAQISTFNSIQATNRAMRGVLQPVQTAVDHAVEQAYELAKRFTPMENYRQVSVPPANLEKDLADVTEQMNAAQDAAAKREYQESANAMRQRLDKYNEVCNQLDQVDAQLAGLKNELDVVMTETVQLEALTPAQAKEQVPQLVERINQEAEQLKQKA